MADVHCNKIIFGLLDVSCEDFFTLCQSSTTRGHSYKLYKAGCSKKFVRSLFFANRVINVWNCLPSNTDFSSLTSFEHTIEMIDISQLLRYK